MKQNPVCISKRRAGEEEVLFFGKFSTFTACWWKTQEHLCCVFIWIFYSHLYHDDAKTFTIAGEDEEGRSKKA